MARGVFTSVLSNQDLTLSTSVETDYIKIGSGGSPDAGLDSAGSVSIQFTTDGTIDTLHGVVTSEQGLPDIELTDTDAFPVTPEGPYDAGTHIVQLSLPVVSFVKTKFLGSAAEITQIRTNVQ